MASFTIASSPVLSSNSRVSSTLTRPRVRARVSSSAQTPTPKPIRAAAAAGLVLTALLSGKLSAPPAMAEPVHELQIEPDSNPDRIEPDSNPDRIELSSDTLESLKALLYKKLNDGEDSEALSLLNRLILLQPSDPDWKFLAARLHNELGHADESRRIYDEILAADPLSFEALFENAVLMDRCGDHIAAIERLESALAAARSANDERSARDVRLIVAQLRFLQKDAEGALGIYEELAKEDPKDYRPWFCQGVIYSLMERNKEARERFARYKELAPKKFEVNAFLQTPLSRAKLCGTEDS